MERWQNYTRAVLTQLTIRRFRGVQDGQVSGLSRVNVLVGPNGCGKSTLLEALYLLSAAFLQQDPLHRTRQNVVIERRNETCEGQYPLAWWFRQDQTESLYFEATVVERVSTGNVDQAVSASYPANGPPDVMAAQKSTIARLEKTLLLDVDSARERSVEENLWLEIFRHRKDKPLIKELNEIYGLQIENLTLSPGRALLAGLPDVGLPIDSLGAGMRVALRVLMSVVAIPGSLLLLEEVDAFQAPDSLSRLATSLVRLAEAGDVQLFISTHRHQTIHAFLSAGATAGVEVRVLPLVRSPEGVLRAKALSRADASALEGSGADLRDLYRFIAPE